jgi:hypothetical protein
MQNIPANRKPSSFRVSGARFFIFFFTQRNEGREQEHPQKTQRNR